jgi:hypothetical protein
MYLTLFIVAAILLFLYFQIRPHLTLILTIIEFMRKVADASLDTASNAAETVVDQTAVGSKLVVNAVADPEPEESRPTKGYCYIGTWKGVRSCVKVDHSCKTDVYSTMKQCVNPTLR